MKNYITQLPVGLHVHDEQDEAEETNEPRPPAPEDASREIKMRLFVLAQLSISAFLLVKIAAMLLRWFL